MIKEKIENIRKDIATYRQAMEDMKDALAVAERELDEALTSENEELEPLPETDGVLGVELIYHTVEIQVTIDGRQIPTMKYEYRENTTDDDECPF